MKQVTQTHSSFNQNHKTSNTSINSSKEQTMTSRFYTFLFGSALFLALLVFHASPSSAVQSVPGVVGNAIQLDGNEKIVVPFHGTYDYSKYRGTKIKQGTTGWYLEANALTIELWVRVDELIPGKPQAILSKARNDNDPGMYVLVGDQGELIFGYYQGPSPTYGSPFDINISDPGLIVPGQWHHLAVSFGRSKFWYSQGFGNIKLLYLDGEAILSSYGPDPVFLDAESGNKDMYFGDEFSGSSNSRALRGAIDDVRVWGAVRNTVARPNWPNPNTAIASNTQGLVGLFNLDEPSGSTSFADATVQSNPATLIINPTIALNGEAEVTVAEGVGYNDPLATATDMNGGTLSVAVDRTIDANTQAGNYTLTYTATDAAGNTGTAERLVNVVSSTWHEMPGSPPRDIAIGSNGDTWAVGPNGNIWKYNPGAGHWDLMDNAIDGKRLDVGIDAVRVITTDGRFYRMPFGGNPHWVTDLGTSHIDVSTGANGDLWCIAGGFTAGLGYEIFKWENGGWVNKLERAMRIAVGPDGIPWIVQENGTVRYYANNYWHTGPGSGAVDIAFGADGDLWAIGGGVGFSGNAGATYRMDKSGGWGNWQWENKNAQSRNIAVGPKNAAWIVDGNGTMKRYGL